MYYNLCAWTGTLQFNSVTFLNYTLKQTHIYWVAASHSTRTKEGQSTVGWCSSTRLFGQLHAVHVNKMGTVSQNVYKNCIMMVKIHFYMNKVTSTGSELPQCCLKLQGLRMKFYSSRPGEMNEPYVTVYMVPYSDCNWVDWSQ